MAKLTGVKEVDDRTLGDEAGTVGLKLRRSLELEALAASGTLLPTVGGVIAPAASSPSHPPDAQERGGANPGAIPGAQPAEENLPRISSIEAAVAIVAGERAAEIVARQLAGLVVDIPAVLDLLNFRGAELSVSNGEGRIRIGDETLALDRASLQRVIPAALITAQGRRGSGQHGLAPEFSLGAGIDLNRARDDAGYYREHREKILALRKRGL